MMLNKFELKMMMMLMRSRTLARLDAVVAWHVVVFLMPTQTERVASRVDRAAASIICPIRFTDRSEITGMRCFMTAHYGWAEEFHKILELKLKARSKEN